MKILTTYEASRKTGLSVVYLRKLMASGKLKGRSVDISKSKSIYLVDSKSLNRFTKTKRRIGRPKKKRA